MLSKLKVQFHQIFCSELVPVDNPTYSSDSWKKQFWGKILIRHRIPILSNSMFLTGEYVSFSARGDYAD
jgi:hypothetical protein